jgi:hypothetical protein
MRAHVSRLAFQLTSPFLLLLLTPAASAQTTDTTIGGLKGVRLTLVLQHETESRLGLTIDRAYKAVEEEIRKAGVNYLPSPERSMTIGNLFRKLPEGYAVLYFQVITVARPGGGDNYAVDVRLDFLDRVRLSRDTSKETVASIYYASQLFLLTGRGGDAEALRRLRYLTREFAANFKAANSEVNRRR